MSNMKFMQGNEAVVHGAIAAGARFFAGYPITPSSEIAENCALLLPKVGGTFIQMEDEMASLACIEGASCAGVMGFTATSGPGFCIMQEHIGHALMCEIPCVIVVVQRGGPSTGLATKPAQGDVMQARWGCNGDHSIIALSPSSVEECYELTAKAFYYAEKYRTPVIVLSDGITGKMYENVNLRKLEAEELPPARIPDCAPEDYKSYCFDPDNIPVLAPFGTKYQVHLSSAMHNELGYSFGSPENSDRCVHYLTDKIDKHIDDITMIKEHCMEDAELVFISYGCSARSARSAVEKLRADGVKAGLLQLLTVWPFPKMQVSAVLKRAKVVAVPELNLGQIYQEIAACNDFGTKLISIPKVTGELLTPQEIIEAVKGEI